MQLKIENFPPITRIPLVLGTYSVTFFQFFPEAVNQMISLKSKSKHVTVYPVTQLPRK